MFVASLGPRIRTERTGPRDLYPNSDMISKIVASVLSTRMAIRWLINLGLDDREDLLLSMWKAVNCSLDPIHRYRLLKRVHKERRMHRYPLSESDQYARSFGIFDTVRELTNVPGDIVECGVGTGLSLASLIYAVSFFRSDKAVYAFDSFAGFPAATTEDRGPRVTDLNRPPAGWTDTSPKLITSVFENDRTEQTSLLRIHDVQLTVIPGFFQDSLVTNLPSMIALLHVDCDLYESTKTVLEHCLPRMSPGGIVIFDEYEDKRWPGAKKAADEVCDMFGLSVSYLDNMRRFGIKLHRNDP